MRVLLSNDDGIHAHGIATMAEALLASDLVSEVIQVAPDRNCSGVSNALTLETPLRVQQFETGRPDFQRHMVNGTPTDCVHWALNVLLEQSMPDIVISGINDGGNLGDDVLYSGTVAAATEGHHFAVPAIAVSLCGRQHYQSAGQVVLELLEHWQSQGFPKGVAGQPLLLNVNVPDLPHEQLKGWSMCRLGYRHRSEHMVEERDPRGRQIFWLGPPGATQDAGQGTDFYAIEQGYVSITPLMTDMTNHTQLTAMESWAKE